MSVRPMPLATYFSWLQSQPNSVPEKIEAFFERLQQTDLNAQPESAMRAIGQQCLNFGTRYEDIIGFAFSPATACEWIQDTYSLGPNQQFEAVAALVAATAERHIIAMPNLKWERVYHGTYDMAVSRQQSDRVVTDTNATPVRSKLRPQPVSIDDYRK